MGRLGGLVAAQWGRGSFVPLYSLADRRRQVEMLAWGHTCGGPPEAGAVGLANKDVSPRPGGEIIPPGESQAVRWMGFWSVGSFTHLEMLYNGTWSLSISNCICLSLFQILESKQCSRILLYFINWELPRELHVKGSYSWPSNTGLNCTGPLIWGGFFW